MASLLRSKPLVVSLALALGAAVLGLWYFGGGGPSDPQDGARDPSGEAAGLPGAEGGAPQAVTLLPPGAEEGATLSTAPATPADPALVDAWENRIDDLLTDTDIPMRDASRELLAMAADARGPEELRFEALQHALNLLDDEDYLDDAGALLESPSLPIDIHEALFSDLHNRPPEVSVPAAERIARTPGHPLAEEARDFIEFFAEDSDDDR